MFLEKLEPFMTFCKVFSRKVLIILDFFRMTGIFEFLETFRFVLDSFNFLEKPIISRKSLAQIWFLVTPEYFYIKNYRDFWESFHNFFWIRIISKSSRLFESGQIYKRNPMDIFKMSKKIQSVQVVLKLKQGYLGYLFKQTFQTFFKISRFFQTIQII